MTGDPLDSQREVLVAALNDARPSPDWAWEVLNVWDSLVEVARAARDVSRIEATGVLPDFQPLAAALARLDGPR